MILNLGEGTHKIEDNILTIKYEADALEPYTLKGINDEHLEINGYYNGNVIIQNSTFQTISISCFANSLILENVHSCEVIINQSSVKIIRSSFESVRINTSRLECDDVTTNDFHIDFKYLFNDYGIREFHCCLKRIKSKALSIQMFHDYRNCYMHTLRLNNVITDEISINLHGFSFQILIEYLVFKQKALRFDVLSLNMDEQSRKELRINSLEAFARCVFTQEEFQKLLSYAKR